MAISLLYPEPRKTSKTNEPPDGGSGPTVEAEAAGIGAAHVVPPADLHVAAVWASVAQIERVAFIFAGCLREHVVRALLRRGWACGTSGRVAIVPSPAVP
eukprot:6624526-Prymnesium_polylepis.1